MSGAYNGKIYGGTHRCGYMHVSVWCHVATCTVLFIYDMCMAGLAMFDQKKLIEAITPIVTAFKFCIRHRKNGLLNRLPSEVRFLCFWLGFCKGR
jgi:hypothetical protein